MKEISLYIHIPFCMKKCFYCDFVSFENKDNEIAKYMKYLLKEVSLYKEKLKEYRLTSIFIGGGTPSHINEEYIEELLSHIYSHFATSSFMEVTIEVNPGTFDYQKVNSYYKSGINRLSMGVQTFHDHLLKDIGRVHSKADIFESYDILRAVGFRNVNFDMMFGLPNQSFEDIMTDLNIIKDLDLQHISYYSLIFEEDTPMEKWYREGKLSLLGEDEERSAYHYIIKALKEIGFNHYEISNFSKDNYQCRHNRAYWEIRPYIGLGLNSHSNFMGERFWNHSNLGEYYRDIDCGKFPIEAKETIDIKIEIAEYSIFGIRLIEGINKEKFKKRFKKDIESIYGDVIRKHINNGLLEDNNKNIKLTKMGLDLANLVELDFFL